MIKFLSSWVEGIAIAVIVASIFEMILPNGNIKKYVKIVLGIFIIFNIIGVAINAIMASITITAKSSTSVNPLFFSFIL